MQRKKKKKYKPSIPYKEFVTNKKIIFIFIVFLVLSAFIGMKVMFFVSLFIVSNALLLTVDRYIDMPIDIEFSTLGAVLCTLTFGLKWGIFVGAASKIAATFYVGKIRADHLFMIFGYIGEAFLTSLLAPLNLNLIALGLTVNILYNIYIFIISKYIMGMRIFDIVGYGVSNLLFNLVLFAGFGKIIFGIMN
ncbi:hypothetical protein GF327_04965 [Candidatus Woesearchaeota archaeon]|nr:hypothetical protein [Candidatus Woesearchaeota archaeon]